MDILIACHCKANHLPVYITDSIINPKAKYYSLYDEKMLPKIKKQFGINKIDYIDKKCDKNTAKSGNQYTNWDDLPLYDAIYLIHCPIYGLFTMEEEYKYIDSIRNFYKDIRNHLKPNGYIYIEKNINPSFLFSEPSTEHNNISINSIIQGDKIEHIRKVYDDIFQSNSNDKSKVKYILNILEGENLDKLPFHISIEKKYSKWYDGRHRVMILKFPTGTSKSKIKSKSKSKTKKHSSKTRKRKL